MNYDSVVSQSGVTDEDFISPVTSIGEVLVNGAIATGSVIAAMTNKTAKYPLPSGQSLEMVGRVRRAALVYRLIDENDYLENSFERYSNATVAGLTSINGQGQAADSQMAFMRRIQVIGIAQQDTEENGSKLFNIHIGGVYTMVNNSNRDIVAGDWLRAYAPRTDEVKQGGRNKEHDQNGYLELWMVPYKASDHQVTSAHMYACLTQNDGKVYMEEYTEMCDKLLDSFMALGVIFVEFMFNRQLVDVKGPNKDRVALYAGLLAELGHSNFLSKSSTKQDLRKELLDALFIDRLVQKGPTYERANYFPGKDTNSQILRDCQFEAVSLGTVTMAEFVHDISRHVFGKAVTSMAPKKNGQVQLCSMIGCK